MYFQQLPDYTVHTNNEAGRPAGGTTSPLRSPAAATRDWRANYRRCRLAPGLLGCAWQGDGV
ncbi:unnamed protein product [Tetraodon nigroviridis]|uniref:(spotted green pufferfish) hypothetical protein n=1 Tax=Tetraodon nigroviridis TaxID=99883 RepID=Q4RP70_TETNG|nr:unnamed protein product [Tetraodon nigroviridis]